MERSDRIINVSAIVEDAVADTLANSGEGEILMVNSAGVYLGINENIIFLCDLAMGEVPIGISIEDFSENVSKLGLSEGERFSFDENRLCFCGGELVLSPLEKSDALPYEMKPVSVRAREAALELAGLDRRSGLSMLVLPLVLERHDIDATSLNPYATKAHPLLFDLMQALAEGREEVIESCVSSLLGLGVGLTPSADDVLLGMIFTLQRLGGEHCGAVRVFLESIEKLCDSRTNRISAAYLKALIAGARFERMESLWIGLSGETDLDCKVLTDIGHSSGTEMLLGILCALRVCGFSCTVQ